MEDFNINKKTGVESYSPLNTLKWIEKMFFECLVNEASMNENEIEKIILIYSEKYKILKDKVKHLIKNKLDEGNVGFTLIAVASYETFIETGKKPNEALILTDTCLNKPSRAYIKENVKKQLDFSDDPFLTIKNESKNREKSYFGDSFEFIRVIDDDYGYILEVHCCLFHEVLKACKRAELQHTLCRMDLGWINAIDPETHNIQFVRPSTYATADLCRMWLMRKEKEMIKD
jgi:hypothetical protein